eukprot:CAMPEP_0178439596 /NCGR_PEP_ID=MMETSP0689_2-20121128/36249_1 /TAXON_ID=160604 /ORGANISM="Amphidinium massartii, Strain CS-259" /LENGTH=151 /DNA_ID=CAMNT_0020062153 /DNA_START=123 /DNA_END=580 /DNA_ORIENTATION=-
MPEPITVAAAAVGAPGKSAANSPSSQTDPVEEGRIIEGPAASIRQAQVDSPVSPKQLLCRSEGGVLTKRLAGAGCLNTRPLAEVHAADERHAAPRVAASLAGEGAAGATIVSGWDEPGTAGCCGGAAGPPIDGGGPPIDGGGSPCPPKGGI